jgi:hypothetical protein
MSGQETVPSIVLAQLIHGSIPNYILMYIIHISYFHYRKRPTLVKNLEDLKATTGKDLSNKCSSAVCQLLLGTSDLSVKEWVAFAFLANTL